MADQRLPEALPPTPDTAISKEPEADSLAPVAVQETTTVTEQLSECGSGKEAGPPRDEGATGGGPPVARKPSASVVASAVFLGAVGAWVAFMSLTGDYLIGAAAFLSFANLLSVLAGSVFQWRRYMNEVIQVGATFATTLVLFAYFWTNP